MKRIIIVFLMLGIFSFLGYFTPIKLYQIQSGSMLPTLQIGEIIILTPKSHYEIDDIITYQGEDSYFITHRIIKITKEGYITQGDANNTEDEKIVTKEQIQGKVIFHSKLLGMIYRYRYYFIGICIFLIIIQRKEKLCK